MDPIIITNDDILAEYGWAALQNKKLTQRVETLEAANASLKQQLREVTEPEGEPKRPSRKRPAPQRGALPI
jgi:hypothetical protein